MKKCRTFKDFEKSHKNKSPKIFDESWEKEFGSCDEKSELTFTFDVDGVEVSWRASDEDVKAFFSEALIKALGDILAHQLSFVERIAMLTTWQVQIEKLMRQFVKSDDLDLDDDECDD